MQHPLPHLTPMKTTKYLVCVDQHEESKAALRLACMKANARGCNVAILHVIAPADFQTLGAIADRMREERKSEGMQLLNTLAEEAFATYGIRPQTILREGPTGDEILAVAGEDADINIIAIGIPLQTAGRGKLTLWLAGQLGHKLLTPLLMVPGNLTDQQLQNLI